MSLTMSYLTSVKNVESIFNSNIQIHLSQTINMAEYDAVFQSLKIHLL